MENLIVLIPLSVGGVFILAGLIFWAFPPRKINRFYGYRTWNAMKSPERWNFAQEYAAKEMVIWGAVLAFTSILGFVYQPNEAIAALIGIGLMVAMIVILFMRVESAIELKFENDVSDLT